MNVLFEIGNRCFYFLSLLCDECEIIFVFLQGPRWIFLFYIYFLVLFFTLEVEAGLRDPKGAFRVFRRRALIIIFFLVFHSHSHSLSLFP